uniref:Serine incorporator n=1 Tax=Kalanchoe fedtschenkoi TaxID=63787 RepID=A0A7N1A064_KALFE
MENNLEAGNASQGNTRSTEDSWFRQFRNGANPLMARYAYGVLFAGVNLFGWAIRDYGIRVLKGVKFAGFHECKDGKDCLGAQGVLRVSLGCFLFYSVMFASTVGTKKLHGARDKWHSGWWSVKIVFWMALTVICFLIPSILPEIYGEIAHIGAGIFLLVQLISIVSFIKWLNDICLSEKYAERWRVYVAVVAAASYVICIVGIIMMFLWYAPATTCLLNIFFITWTLVLLQLITSVSLHPKINAGFLAPGLMGLYIVFNCWCAIRSEPPEETCFKSSHARTADWLNIISFVIGVLTIVIATFSTGIDSKSFQFKKQAVHPEEEDRTDHVPYGYGFFHFVFAAGAMYFAMLLVGWNTRHHMQKWTIDVGWTSTWVRIANEWLAVCVYIWMLVAPVIFKSRGMEESV